MSMSSWIVGICLVALGGGTAYLWQTNQDLQERITTLEAGPRARMDHIEEHMDTLAQRVNDNASRLESGGDAASGKTGGTFNLAALADDPAFQKAVERVAMELTGDVRFRAKLGLTGSPNLPKKPAFHQLAAALELDAVQEEKLRKDLLHMKETFMALVSEERDDGIVPLERFAEADAMEPSDPRRGKIFFEILQLKIPGSGEETYLSRLMDLQGEMRKNAQEYLRPAQKEIWASLDVDWMGIQME